MGPWVLINAPWYYVRYLRLRESFGDVELINARQRPDLVARLARENVYLDDGMVLLMNGQCFHGSECVNRLALASTPSTAFNKVNGFIFAHESLSKALYPLLRSCRNLALWLMRIRKIAPER